MYLEIEHRLSLTYDAFVRESVIELRMQPKTTAHQTLRSFVLAAGPPAPISRYRDWNDNAVHHFTVGSFHDRVVVIGRSVVKTHPAAPSLDALADPPGSSHIPYTLWDFLQFGGPVRDSAALRDLADAVGAAPGAPLGAQVAAMGAALRAHLRYRKHVTRYDSTSDDALAARAGVCQDFAHLMLALLRLRRIPCRYVSGYLHVDPPDGGSSQSHAWVEVHVPSAGWVPYDPTHARELDERYVTVAHGRHYEDVPPNRGTFRGDAREILSADVRSRPSTDKAVSALHEEIEEIDLPVFREMPQRHADWAATAADEAAAQAQQQ